MHRELLLSSIVESSVPGPARPSAAWKALFFAALFAALAFCGYAHGEPAKPPLLARGR